MVCGPPATHCSTAVRASTYPTKHSLIPLPPRMHLTTKIILLNLIRLTRARTRHSSNIHKIALLKYLVHSLRHPGQSIQTAAPGTRSLRLTGLSHCFGNWGRRVGEVTFDPWRCPACGGQMILIEVFASSRAPPENSATSSLWNTP